ncbi:ABC transporter permease [Kutzneria sp. NPDC052558]|uniref:ABC transporter permease n=1 Tax=Kutzneria sp. NPDC052558 TaxID=3364121 RepID=UPI0037CBB4D9
MTSRTALRIIEFGTPVVLLALWWFGSAVVNSYYFPPLSQILRSFVDTWLLGDGASQIPPTLLAIAIGYVSSVVLGVALGILLASAPRLNEFVRPALDFFRTVPTSAATPILIVIIGVDTPMKVAIVMMSALWVVLLNTGDGLAGIDHVVRETCGSYRLRPVDRLFRVYLPAAGPQIVTGLRVALYQAIILVIVAETLVSTGGVGSQIILALWNFQLTVMWSGIVLVGLISLILTRVFTLAQRRALRWHSGLHGRAQR